jgi:PAS domain S-box-containing protein
MRSTEKVNILMVDDQPAKLLSYEAILAELGENLIKANSGREALEHLLRTDVAVVLMDVSMPEMDGFEIAEMIRQHPRFQKIAIIFISAVHLTDLDRLKGYEHGAVDYISVPVVPDVLRAKVSVFAELHRKTRELEALNVDLELRVAERTEELRESEAQFRTLANSIPQLAWIANPDGTVVWYNQRWFDYTGADAAELEPQGWKKYHHPDHVNRVAAGLERSWRTGEEWEDTCLLRAREGQYRWFLSRAVPIRDSHGKVVRWFGTSTDIHRQMAAEEQVKVLNAQLRQRLTELETIMQVLPVGVCVAHDPECTVITGNAALHEMLGGDLGSNISLSQPRREQLPYQAYRDGKIIYPGQMPVQQAALTGKSIPPTEIEICRQDGQVLHTLTTASPLFDEAGELRGAVGALVDVTARKNMEDVLRQRAELLDLASEAIMVRDSSGIVQFWNAGAEALYGWSRQEAVGKNVHELLQTRYPQALGDIEASIQHTGRWDGNISQFDRNGREVVVASRQALMQRNGAQPAILEINRDITAQLFAEEALRKTERLAAMGRVAGIIAHEINNPLEAITNAFYLLHEHPSLDSEARSLAAMADEELQRVVHITRQTLSFYRESQQAVLVSMAKILDDVLELQSRSFRLKGIILEKDYLTDGPIFGFPAELKQVFLNLVGNAVQAMPEGGRLRVKISSCRQRDHLRPGLRVSVSDTGTGIKPEDARRLFEPFFTTKSAKGTGLGLWISKGIIQKYDGRIYFRSLRLNGRNTTCFSVYLPGARSVQLPENAKVQEAIGSA